MEYIRVLKKREHRLRAEHARLKSLIGGLVGGPALVEEWEWEWKLKFGGEEQDEVEGAVRVRMRMVMVKIVRMGKEKKKSWERRGNVPRSPADRATKKSGSPVVGTNDQVPEKRQRNT